ncbi:hypothetical protein SADUNF_Sadunf16G0191600 [Salix dunnii]|uniref:NB-ARC domain-containing protein n=1 Tax=Salix dunnii TaxID=1413687 RepID=A0A835MHE6_9ROSI|nr:hypothetical protein SADUNF_Sadunf16G0191600 [Salix dunnii]
MFFSIILKAFYISKLKENVDRLRDAVEELKDLNSDVKRAVEVKEEQQLKQLDQVRGWISRAEAAISKSNELLRDGPQEIEKQCLGGYCSKNYKSSYRFAKKVDEGLREVADLTAKGGFKTVAGKIPTASGIPRPSDPTVGLESTFNKVWTWLKEEKQVGIVGLYGMGGVGKTTVLTQINNESLKKPNDFDIVIWVVVSKDLKPDTVQESIRRKIGFSDDVLDLSNNKSLLRLPRDVCKLVSLQYLNLSRTGIKALPTELKALVKLRYLNLEYTPSLYLLPHGVISCFPMMHILRMFRCGSSKQEAEECILSRDESLVYELQCLKELNVLTVTIRSASALERLSSSRGLQNSTRVLHLERFHDSKLVNFSSLANMQNLDTLRISQSWSFEEMQIDWERELQKMQAPNNLAHVTTTERPFPSLSRVDVEDCMSMRNLNWLILAQNLTFLSVSNCPNMVEVASIEKLPEDPEVVENLNPFAKLKAVELLFLPRLKSFYLNAQPLPSVKDVRVIGCPFLEKRPASL